MEGSPPPRRHRGRVTVTYRHCVPVALTRWAPEALPLASKSGTLSRREDAATALKVSRMQVVFLHGFPLDGRMWKGQLDVMPCAVRCPTLYRFGNAMEAWAAGVLESIGDEPAVVVGASMGLTEAPALFGPGSHVRDQPVPLRRRDQGVEDRSARPPPATYREDQRALAAPRFRR